MGEPLHLDQHLVEVVARALAKTGDKFIGASDWRGDVGNEYRIKALAVLKTVDNYNRGIRSGGLP